MNNEALRLADEADHDEWISSTNQWRDEAAAEELRRLHEVNRELVEALVLILNTCNSDLEYRVNTSRELDIMYICKTAIAKSKGESK